MGSECNAVQWLGSENFLVGWGVVSPSQIHIIKLG